MLNALNTAATGMQAQDKQVSVISNNIANADTVSFKKSRTEFQDLLYQNIKEPGAATSATTTNPTGVQVGVGVQVAAVSRELTMGSPRNTGRPLDMMISGQGYFSVQLPSGEVAYTRDGSFQLDAENRIVTNQGFPLVPEVVIPPNSRMVNIAPDGRVTATLGNNEIAEAGQIQVSTFANPAGLSAEGGNLFVPSQGSGAPVPGNPGQVGYGSVLAQHLEASNVQPVTEMTDLVRAQRVYEMNSKVISSADQMMNTINQMK